MKKPEIEIYNRKKTNYLAITLHIMSVIFLLLGMIIPGLNIYFVTGLIFWILGNQHKEGKK